ncbi:hypothetical protein CKO38_13895 [Rhodospirillum rubrum]|uniref:BPL-N domain-containing protein n=1 Tax=Rhodospirillum rubrum TaxID=1085 RepID=UPI0019089DB1|nr:BPL-N domain-containing protein [Rhodospirillum rubrum]MBK1665667.1 hypothetical protein [Rhodospirillum rubrum]MBK1677740.1 hypothetical protein [Rhodospirillum rubrum]
MMERDQVAVYIDEGAVFEDLLCEVAREMDHDRARLRPVMAEDILAPRDPWDRTLCLIVPGGADGPYCAALNGEGNDRIRAFVAGGGRYLGICAGAYYACREIAFHAGRADAVVGQRDLALLAARAIGSLDDLAPPYDRTLASAAAVRLDWPGLGVFRGHYHGGPRFEIDPGAAITVLARFGDVPGCPPAVVQASLGQGMVVACSVHLEQCGATLEARLPSLCDGETHRALAWALGSDETLRRRAFRQILALCRVPLKPWAGDRAAA